MRFFSYWAWAAAAAILLAAPAHGAVLTRAFSFNDLSYEGVDARAEVINGVVALQKDSDTGNLVTPSGLQAFDETVYGTLTKVTVTFEQYSMNGSVFTALDNGSTGDVSGSFRFTERLFVTGGQPGVVMVNETIDQTDFSIDAVGCTVFGNSCIKQEFLEISLDAPMAYVFTGADLVNFLSLHRIGLVTGVQMLGYQGTADSYRVGGFLYGAGSVALVASASYRVDYEYTPIPLPPAALLFLAGAAGFGAFGRARKVSRS